MSANFGIQAAGAPVPSQNFERFRALVLQDPALQETLRETPDLDTFVTLVVQLGQAHGYPFTAEDVEAAMRASRRAWFERRIA